MNRFIAPLAAAGLFAAGLLLPQQDAAAAGLSATAEAPQFVSLNRHIVVQEDLVRLGHIFSGLEMGADTPVGRAPTPGAPVRLDARWLGALAQTYGIDWQPVSRLDTAQVERAALRLESEDILELLQDAFLDRGEVAELELQLDEPASAVVLPLVDGARIGIVGLNREARGRRFTGTLVYPDNGPPLARIAISGRVHELIEVPVATRRLSRDSVILAGDLEWVQLRADRLPNDVALDPADLIGKAPRRNLRQGEAIRSGDVAHPVLVQKNSMVTLRLRTTMLNLSTLGRALEDGAEGATIRVMNTSSNTVVLGVVATDGIVYVTADSNRAIY